MRESTDLILLLRPEPSYIHKTRVFQITIHYSIQRPFSEYTSHAVPDRDDRSSHNGFLKRKILEIRTSLHKKHRGLLYVLLLIFNHLQRGVNILSSKDKGLRVLSGHYHANQTLEDLFHKIITCS